MCIRNRSNSHEYQQDLQIRMSGRQFCCMRTIGGSTSSIFGLLGDILYRSVVLKEAPWDLFALIGATGLISGAYAARHKVVVVNRRFMISWRLSQCSRRL